MYKVVYMTLTEYVMDSVLMYVVMWGIVLQSILSAWQLNNSPQVVSGIIRNNVQCTSECGLPVKWIPASETSITENNWMLVFLTGTFKAFWILGPKGYIRMKICYICYIALWSWSYEYLSSVSETSKCSQQFCQHILVQIPIVLIIDHIGLLMSASGALAPLIISCN